MRRSNWQSAAVIFVITLCWLAAAARSAIAAPPPYATILGVWRGSSICTDRVVAPACKDEQVVYHFERLPNTAEGHVTLKADKLIDGKPAPMGELDLTYDAMNDRWSSELQTRSGHYLWAYSVKGRSMSGMLIDLPTGKQVRKVSAQKD